MRPVPTLLALSLLAAGASFANAAHAAEGDDRFAIRLGAMNIDSDNTAAAPLWPARTSP